MKLKKSKSEASLPESYKNYDGCPVCRLLQKAAEEGRELTGEEVEKAFAEAEKESFD